MFRRLTDSMYVSPQISVDQVDAAKAMGVTMIINNRPDDEEPGQVNGAEIEAAAKAAGLGYAAVPVSHGGFAPWQLDGMAAALEQAGTGKVLAYCRSGTRSITLDALANPEGLDPATLIATAKAAGYDLSALAPRLNARNG